MAAGARARGAQAAHLHACPSPLCRLLLQVDPNLWKLELERVAPKLRILLNADAKDWRSHLEEVHDHSKVPVCRGSRWGVRVIVWRDFSQSKAGTV